MNRLSYSSVERFLECPQKYYLHDVKKIREVKTSSSLLVGKAIDNGLNTLLLTRDLNKALSDFEQSWFNQEINGVVEDIRSSPNVRFLKSDLDESLLSNKDSVDNKAWSSLRAKGELLITEYAKQVLPKIKRVIAVQEELLLETDSDDKFVGFADMIVEWEDGRIILFDNKTTSRAYKQEDVAQSRQLATYYNQLKDKYKLDAVGFITLDKNIRKREPRVRLQILIDKPLDSVIELTMNNYSKVNYLVEQGAFPKDEQNCFGKYGRCGFYDLCHNNSMEGLVCVKKK